MSLTTTGGNGGSLVPQNMDQAVRLADMMAKTKTLPEHLRNSPGDCLMVVEQAMRWQMSPFAVAQCTASIKGKLSYEGKLIAAVVQHMGAIKGHFDYAFDGAGDNRTITVSATRSGESEPKTVKVRLGDAKTDNRMWTIQPDQQLVYHGNRVWARRWTPGPLLGIYTPEEWDEEEKAKTLDDFTGTTINANAEPQTRDSINAETAPKPRTRAQWLGELDEDLRQCGTKEEVLARLATDDVTRALAEFTNGAKVKLEAVILTHKERVGAVLDDPDAPESMNT